MDVSFSITMTAAAELAQSLRSTDSPKTASLFSKDWRLSILQLLIMVKSASAPVRPSPYQPLIPIDFDQIARPERDILVETHPHCQTIHRTFCSLHLLPRSRSNYSHLSRASWSASLQRPLTLFKHLYFLYYLPLRVLPR